MHAIPYEPKVYTPTTITNAVHKEHQLGAQLIEATEVIDAIFSKLICTNQGVAGGVSSAINTTQEPSLLDLLGTAQDDNQYSVSLIVQKLHKLAESLI